MIKYCFLIFLVFLLSSCMKPTDNKNLQIKIIEEGLVLEISEEKNIINNRSGIPVIINSAKGGTVGIEEKQINRNEYDDKAKLYCSRFNKVIGKPVFYKGVGYYKCIELN